MKNKLIITKLNGRLLTALAADQKVLQMNFEEAQGQLLLGNIYVGRVKNIVKNINAAFIEFGEGLIGYYSLAENKNPIYIKSHSPKQLVSNDEILIQISREGVKTKAPVLTSHLNFTGKYVVLTVGKTTFGISSKIQDEKWKTSVKQLLSVYKSKEYGLIIRTNAVNVSDQIIIQEIEHLLSCFQKIKKEAPYRLLYSLVYKAPVSYLTGIRDAYENELEEIITDIPEFYKEMKSYLQLVQPDDLRKLFLYEDPLLPLHKLYSIETALEQALNKKAWLKSGGYLVIEPTEALVVIDVNTGKYAGKKNVQDTIRKINLEAAYEVGRQLRLRNLSGIIVVDFIGMEREESKEELLRVLDTILQQDPVKTTVVEITKLDLVEITRKKVRKPLYEQIAMPLRKTEEL